MKQLFQSKLTKAFLLILLVGLLYIAEVKLFYLLNKPKPADKQKVNGSEADQDPQSRFSIPENTPPVPAGEIQKNIYEGIDVSKFKNIVGLPNYLSRIESKINIKQGTISLRTLRPNSAKNADRILFLGNFGVEDRPNAFQLILKDGREIHFDIFDSNGNDDNSDADVVMGDDFFNNAHDIEVSWNLVIGKKRIYVDGKLVKESSLQVAEIHESDPNVNVAGLIEDLNISEKFK